MAYYDTELDSFMDRFGTKDEFTTNKFTAKAFGDSGKTGLADFDKKNNTGFSQSLTGFQQNSNKQKDAAVSLTSSAGTNNKMGGGLISGASAGGSGKAAGKGKGMTGGQMQAAGAMFGGIGDSMRKKDGSTVIAGDENDNAMVDGTKDAVAGVLGPFGQLFRGIQKAGQGMGDAIGGESGAAVSDVFSPEESTIANFKDGDLSFGEKLLGTVPGLGGVIAHRSKKNKLSKKMTDRAKLVDKVESAIREQEYDQEQGVAANRELKRLREMQLGVIQKG